MHSDGAIRPLLPSIIEMGVDLLNPVQTTAAGMDPDILQSEFGDKLVLHMLYFRRLGETEGVSGKLVGPWTVFPFIP